MRESEASTRAKRTGESERGASIFFFPHPTPLRWRSINPPRFIFYHARSTDFEEKIEGLSGAPNENIVQNHLNIALLKVF